MATYRIYKRLDSTVQILSVQSGQVVATLQEVATLVFAAGRNGGVTVTDRLARSVQLLIEDVEEVQIEPNAPLAFNGSVPELYDLLQTDFFDNLLKGQDGQDGQDGAPGPQNLEYYGAGGEITVPLKKINLVGTTNGAGSVTFDLTAAGFTAINNISVTAFLTSGTIQNRAWATMSNAVTLTSALAYGLRGNVPGLFGSSVRTAPNTTISITAEGF